MGTEVLLLKKAVILDWFALRILVRVEFVVPKGRPGLGAFLTSGTVGFVQLNFPIKRRLF
jgi:hypothetical protein